jgi:hypothetical protein
MDSDRESLLEYLGWSRRLGLSGSLCFYASDLGNLPIIVSYPITSLMLFVHLHIVWQNRILSSRIYGLVSGGSSIQWDLVWRLYRPLRGLFPVTAVKGPKHSHRRGVRSIVYAGSAPGHTDCCGIHRSDSPVGLHNPPCGLTSTVGPSLPGFTIALCVDSLLCYRIDHAA